MEKRFLSAALCALAITAVSLAKSDKGGDPTLMTVNGQAVSLSEFEYLYHKNNSQQVSPQTLDEYVDMFVTYKLKVADAQAAGIDTTAAFNREFRGYRDELARPYLRDNAVEEQLIRESYSHMQENVDIDHLMLPLDNPNSSDQPNKHLADSLRQAIVNGTDFYEVAKAHSIDPGVGRNSGHTGWVSTNQYPYEFEQMMYETPIGEISPVFTTAYGYHVIRVNARRPNPGEVHVQHILKMFDQQRSPENDAATKAKIDSVYTLLQTPGADFAAIAKAESEDPGSARNGGELPWFGTGRMVKEFETVAFELKDGETSAPFASAFGYHIIHKIGRRAVASLEEARPTILNAMSRDNRANAADRAKLQELKEAYGTQLVPSTLDYIHQQINEHGACDSTVIATLATCDLPVIKIADKTIPLSDYASQVPTSMDLDAETGYNVIVNGLNNKANYETLEYEKSQLSSKYPDFRNLVNEYRDGMMLFEISNQNVWDKSSKDKAGLEAFFQQNRANYTWDSPKYKGFVIYATRDSIIQEVNKYLATNTVEADSVAFKMRQLFGRDVKTERVVMAKGDNAVVDAIAFGQPAPDRLNEKWRVYTSYLGKVIDAPEEAADVRGPVTTDYQAYLENEWVKTLKEKYPVKINKKVLKKVK
jgi:peptidyl-prolyl cis-trans isomerase SurA